MHPCVVILSASKSKWDIFSLANLMDVHCCFDLMIWKEDFLFLCFVYHSRYIEREEEEMENHLSRIFRMDVWVSGWLCVCMWHLLWITSNNIPRQQLTKASHGMNALCILSYGLWHFLHCDFEWAHAANNRRVTIVRACVQCTLYIHPNEVLSEHTRFHVFSLPIVTNNRSVSRNCFRSKFMVYL